MPKIQFSTHKEKWKIQGKQEYKCNDCEKQFVTKSRESVLQKVLWKKYIWQQQTIKQLAGEYGKSIEWIHQQLDKAKVNKPIIRSCSVVIVADMTFVKRTFGVAVIRAPYLRKNLVWKDSLKETSLIYHELRWELEKQGFEVTAAVIDGKPGLIYVFWDVPIQMCYFHQIAIMTRYLTTRPKLIAGQTLRQIALCLSKSNEDRIKEALNIWYEQWKEFLKEKTFNPETKRWFYAHKRLRSAYRSIIRNFPILYTYQKYPKFKFQTLLIH